MLSLDIDPKLAWALRHRDRFPLDVNRASREDLLRVPGFGAKAVDRILATRRITSIRAADLARLHVPRNKVLPFIVLATTGRRICSTARGWRSGSSRRRRSWDLGFERTVVIASPSEATAQPTKPQPSMPSRHWIASLRSQ